MKDEGGMMRGGGMKVKVEKEGEEIGMIEGDWEEEGEEVIGEEQEKIAEVDLDREMKKVEEQKERADEAKHRMREMAAETEALRRRMEELSYRYV